MPVIIPAPVSVERRREPSQLPSRLKDIAVKVLLRLEDDSRPLYWGLLVAFFAAWIWWDVLSNDPFPATAIAVVCLLGICVAASRLIPRVRDLGFWKRRAIAVAAFVPLIYIWSWFDGYTEFRDGEYVKTYINKYKFGQDPYFVTNYAYQPDLKARDGSLEIAAVLRTSTTPDGIYHGEGTVLWMDDLRVERIFHWYGDRISEGEWHLRNK